MTTYVAEAVTNPDENCTIPAEDRTSPNVFARPISAEEDPHITTAYRAIVGELVLTGNFPYTDIIPVHPDECSATADIEAETAFTIREPKIYKLLTSVFDDAPNRLPQAYFATIRALFALDISGGVRRLHDKDTLNYVIDLPTTQKTLGALGTGYLFVAEGNLNSERF